MTTGSRINVLRQKLRPMIWARHYHFGSKFDLAVMIAIFLSIIAISMETLPDLPAESRRFLYYLNWVIVVFYTVEYALRIFTHSQPSKYIFSFWGIVDLAAFAPFWLFPGAGTAAIRMMRLVQLLKMMRYVAALARIERAMQLMWRELMVVMLLALMMLFITAVGIYNFEHEAQPEAFKSIPHSFWFAVATLTTVGYGDVYPITAGGRFFTFIILMIGLGIVALPAGIMSAALTQAREEERALKKSRKTGDGRDKEDRDQ